MKTENNLAMEKQATKKVMAPPIQDVVSRLSDMIGAKFVAYATSVSEPQVIQEWINGRTTPPNDTETKLRLTYRVSKILYDRFCDRDTLQAWFQGKNPDLGDHCAVVMIRLAEDPSKLEYQLVSAAQTFAAK
jgi:hypothetical protein